MEQKIDVLNRENFVKEVIDILEILSENKSDCCFAINGQWGSGKTFVLDMLKEKIKDVQSEDTNTDKYFLFNYNCWKYDYYEEPSISIISSIKDSIDEEFKTFNQETDKKIKASWEVAKENIGKIAGKFTENHIGINVVEIYSDTKEKYEKERKEQNKFNSMFAFTETLDETRKSLQKIAQEKTMILIVDELDRCIPSYAIKVLERLHHIFEGINNTIVIIAIDNKQLEHSIKQIYGKNIDTNKYLKKFISFTKDLPLGNVNSDVLTKYQTYISKFTITPDESTELVDDLHIILSDIDIRQQEKIINKANMIHSLICTEKKEASLLLFEILMLRYETFTTNKDLTWLININDQDSIISANTLSSHYKEKLKPLCKTGVTGERVAMYTTNSNPLSIKDNLIGKALWLLSGSHNIFTVYASNSDSLKELLPIAKAFKTMTDSIS